LRRDWAAFLGKAPASAGKVVPIRPRDGFAYLLAPTIDRPRERFAGRPSKFIPLKAKISPPRHPVNGIRCIWTQFRKKRARLEDGDAALACYHRHSHLHRLAIRHVNGAAKHERLRAPRQANVKQSPLLLSLSILVTSGKLGYGRSSKLRIFGGSILPSRVRYSKSICAIGYRN